MAWEPYISAAEHRQLLAEIARLSAECEEQARLNGMGAEREADLRGQITRLRSYNEGQDKIVRDLEAQNERLRAALDQIAYQAANQDMDHKEFRVAAHRIASGANEQITTEKPDPNKEYYDWCMEAGVEP